MRARLSSRLSGAAALLLALVALSLAPTSTATAALSHAAIIKRSFTALKLLPTGATSATRVRRLVYRLVTFDPRKTIKYVRIGVTKLYPNDRLIHSLRRIVFGVAEILKTSGLPIASINSILRALNNIIDPPEVFPPPPASGP